MKIANLANLLFDQYFTKTNKGLYIYFNLVYCNYDSFLIYDAFFSLETHSSSFFSFHMGREQLSQTTISVNKNLFYFIYFIRRKAQ